MLYEQGHAPPHTVLIHQRVQVASAGCSVCKLGQHAGVARVRLGAQGAQAPVGGGHALGQAGTYRRNAIVKSKTQHHRAGLHGLGKQLVKRQARAPFFQRLLELCISLELVFGQGLQHRQARGLVFFRQNQIQRHQRRLLLKQQRHQPGQAVARPGPAALATTVFLEQAFLIDVHHHDALIQGSRCQGPHPQVIEHRLQPGQQRQAVPLCRMASEQGHQPQPEQHTPGPQFAKAAGHGSGGQRRTSSTFR